jgi:integrase
MCVLSAEEVARFQAEAPKYPNGFVLTFTLATGMRPGEVQALQWGDCDLGAGSATVQRSLVHLKGGRWEFGEPKTRQSRRTIPLPRSVARDLAAHRASQAAYRLQIRREYEDHDLVFAGRTGTPLDGQNVANRTLKPILEAAGLPRRFRWYDCRHTCATLLLAAGENPKVVSERLGHATVAFTLDRYAHVLPGMQERATERLEGILYGSP